MSEARSGVSRARTALSLLALLVVVIAGCAKPREPGLGEGVVIVRPETGDEFTPEQRAQVEERIREVEILLVREELTRALAVVDGLLSRDLPADLVGRLRGLRLDIRKRRHEQPTVEGRLRTDRDLYAFGDTIRLVLGLVNRSDLRVRIPRVAPDSSKGYLFLRIVRREIDVYGNVREDVEQGRRDLPGEVKIPAGETRWAEFSLPVGPREHDGLTEFRISGHIRPSVIRIGRRDDFRSIPLDDVVVKVLPRNYEPMAEDPLGSLRKAIEKRAAIHLLVAAELTATVDRGAAARMLIDSIRPGADGLVRPAVAALRRLTGEDHGLDASAWVKWWDAREGASRE